MLSGSVFQGLSILFGALSLASRIKEHSIQTNTSPFGAVSFGKPVLTEVRVHNVNDRVKHLIKMINKYAVNVDLREEAINIVTKRCGNKWCIAEKDWWKEAYAIFDSIRSRVRYLRDPVKKDWYTNPLRVLNQYHAGDCDCYTILLGALYMSIGYPVKVKVIQSIGNRDWNHIYLLVGIPTIKAGKKAIAWVPADGSVSKEQGGGYLGFQASRFQIVRQKIYGVYNV